MAMRQLLRRRQVLRRLPSLYPTRRRSPLPLLWPPSETHENHYRWHLYVISLAFGYLGLVLLFIVYDASVSGRTRLVEGFILISMAE